MRDISRCWSRGVAQCETLFDFGVVGSRSAKLFVVFVNVEPRNARLSSLLEWFRREMRDARRFWSRGSRSAKLFVVFVSRGIMGLHSMRPSSLLESCRRKMRDSSRFGMDRGAIRVTVMAYGLLNKTAL